jgi:2Fe-2S ferredoxin
MPKITYVEHNGTEHQVDAENGKSVMQTAVDNLVTGILGDCGGCCSCATCHGYVDKTWLAKLPPVSEGEAMMLEGAMNVKDNSRLTCQIVMTPELDGLVVHLPASQI